MESRLHWIHKEKPTHKYFQTERDGDKGIPKMTMWLITGNMKTWLEFLISYGEYQEDVTIALDVDKMPALNMEISL